MPFGIPAMNLWQDVWLPAGGYPVKFTPPKPPARGVKGPIKVKPAYVGTKDPANRAAQLRQVPAPSPAVGDAPTDLGPVKPLEQAPERLIEGKKIPSFVPSNPLPQQNPSEHKLKPLVDRSVPLPSLTAGIPIINEAGAARGEPSMSASASGQPFEINPMLTMLLLAGTAAAIILVK